MISLVSASISSYEAIFSQPLAIRSAARFCIRMRLELRPTERGVMQLRPAGLLLSSMCGP
jgi:hypothetical protein